MLPVRRPLVPCSRIPGRARIESTRQVVWPRAVLAGIIHKFGNQRASACV